MKDLFDQGPKKIIEGSLGEVEYIDDFLTLSEADEFFKKINTETPWERPLMKYYGKTFPIPRDTAWFGEKSYVYSGIRNKPNPMTNALKELRKKAEDKCAYSFNSLLINRYQNGNDKVGWHADDEPELEGCEVIASISLGAAREFKLRKKNYDKQKDTVHKILLEHGSLLIMRAPLQKFWEHEVPKKAIDNPRLNLTFRKVD